MGFLFEYSNLETESWEFFSQSLAFKFHIFHSGNKGLKKSAKGIGVEWLSLSGLIVSLFAWKRIKFFIAAFNRDVHILRHLHTSKNLSQRLAASKYLYLWCCIDATSEISWSILAGPQGMGIQGVKVPSVDVLYPCGILCRSEALWLALRMWKTHVEKQ